MAHDVIGDALTSNFVVSLEDVVEVLDGVVLVAHGGCGCPGRHGPC